MMTMGGDTNPKNIRDEVLDLPWILGMDSLMKGRTTFVIAHRLSTVRNSDLIVVLEQGRIIEQGTHDELIELGQKYYQLYTGGRASA